MQGENVVTRLICARGHGLLEVFDELFQHVSSAMY